MQNDSPPHFAITRERLFNSFPGRVIKRRGNVEWPQRSLDLTPLDLFFWGYLKEKAYDRKECEFFRSGNTRECDWVSNEMLVRTI